MVFTVHGIVPPHAICAFSGSALGSTYPIHCKNHGTHDVFFSVSLYLSLLLICSCLLSPLVCSPFFPLPSLPCPLSLPPSFPSLPLPPFLPPSLPPPSLPSLPLCSKHISQDIPALVANIRRLLHIFTLSENLLQTSSSFSGNVGNHPCCDNTRHTTNLFCPRFSAGELVLAFLAREAYVYS